MDISFLILEKDKSTKSPVKRIWRESRNDPIMHAFTGIKSENSPITLNTAYLMIVKIREEKSKEIDRRSGRENGQ